MNTHEPGSAEPVTSAQLFQAIQDGDLDLVQTALAQDRTWVDARRENGISTVMMALYHQQPEILDLLLVASPTLDVHEAAALGELERLEDLLETDPTLAQARSFDGFTALHLACFFARPEAAWMLIDHDADVNAIAENPSEVRPLHSAAAGCSAEIVRLLLAAGAIVNATQRGGWTALHAAARRGDVAMTRVLLDHHADVSAASDDGQTALDMARANDHQDIIELLQP